MNSGISPHILGIQHLSFLIFWSSSMGNGNSRGWLKLCPDMKVIIYVCISKWTHLHWHTMNCLPLPSAATPHLLTILSLNLACVLNPARPARGSVECFECVVINSNRKNWRFKEYTLVCRKEVGIPDMHCTSQARIQTVSELGIPTMTHNPIPIPIQFWPCGDCRSSNTGPEGHCYRITSGQEKKKSYR